MDTMDLINKLIGVDNEFFDRNGRPVHMNANYFKSMHFKFIKTREKIKRSKSKCAMPGCQNTCVSSHTIPEATVLKRISYKGEVINLAYEESTKKFNYTLIDTKQASAFNGLCQEHENWFAGFEKEGDFNHRSIAIQNLRVVLRYYSLWTNLLYAFERSLKNYKNELKKYNQEKFTLLNKSILIKEVEDDISIYIKQQIDFINHNIAIIHNEELYPFLKTINGDGDFTSIIAIQIDIELPVCLAGKSEFSSDDKKYTVYLSVFPKPNGTFCCFTFPTENKSSFNKLLEKYKNDSDFIGFIESWMIYGTDQWYISPIEWNSYSFEKQNKILELMQTTDYFPDKALDFFILENARDGLRY